MDSDVTDSQVQTEGRELGAAMVALAAFGALCVAALIFRPLLMEPDDYAYNASIIAITHGHLFTLTTAQAQALTAGLPQPAGGLLGIGAPVQWVQLSDGRWISEKDPGYPYLAAPFQLLGLIRLAPLFYGALGCGGLYLGARRWLGRFGGAAAVGLYCSSGAALFFAWRDYMPTFTEASLIAAGIGVLLWAVLAVEHSDVRRTVAGLAGFAALECAAFVRYTDFVVLGCAVVAVYVVGLVREARVPRMAVLWWVGSVLVFGAAVALFNDAVYGAPLASGYRPGEISFALGAVPDNLKYMPAHLIEAMPVLVLAFAALVWIVWRRVRLSGGDGEFDSLARRDFAVGLSLAVAWFSIWGLYAAYTWTTVPLSTMQVVRFYVPAIGAIALLAAWLVVRVRRRALVGVLAAVLLVAFGLGLPSFDAMRGTTIGPRSPSVLPSAQPSSALIGAAAGGEGRIRPAGASAQGSK